MNSKKFWILSLGLNILTITGIALVSNHNSSRQPASAFSPVTLEIKNIKLPENTQISSLHDISLVATFNQSHKLDLLGEKKLSLNMGQTLDLDLKLAIDSDWIQNDQLEFKIELVQKGFLDQVLVRCAQVSKKISDYNRSYQCFLPESDDQALSEALLTYRISTDSKSAPKAIAQK